MWSAVRSTQQGAGGFLDASYDGGSKQEEKSPDAVRSSSIVPVMIGHLQQDYSTRIKMWGTEISIISLVAYVRALERVTTKISYELVDETGSIQAYQWLESGKSTEPVTVPVGSYARATGTLRQESGKCYVFLLNIVPVTSMTDIFEHLLEVTYICLKGKEMSVEQDSNKVDNFSRMDQDANESCRGMNGDQALVFGVIKSENDSDKGIERSDLKAKLPPNIGNNLDALLEFLVNEGHIYTTSTDDHFKAT